MSQPTFQTSPQSAFQTTLLGLFDDCLQRYAGAECVCLSTTDGFPVASRTLAHIQFEADAMAAASSTLFSVSNAVSQQMLDRPFRVAFVESERGNMAFVSLSVGQQDYVLTMSASDEMNIGQLRAFINRLARQIVEQCDAPEAPASRLAAS